MSFVNCHNDIAYSIFIKFNCIHCYILNNNILTWKTIKKETRTFSMLYIPHANVSKVFENVGKKQHVYFQVTVFAESLATEVISYPNCVLQFQSRYMRFRSSISVLDNSKSSGRSVSSRLSSSYRCTRWDTTYTFASLERHLVRGEILRNQGPKGSPPGRINSTP